MSATGRQVEVLPTRSRHPPRFAFRRGATARPPQLLVRRPETEGTRWRTALGFLSARYPAQAPESPPKIGCIESMAPAGSGAAYHAAGIYRPHRREIIRLPPAC